MPGLENHFVEGGAIHVSCVSQMGELNIVLHCMATILRHRRAYSLQSGDSGQTSLPTLFTFKCTHIHIHTYTHTMT